MNRVTIAGTGHRPPRLFNTDPYSLINKIKLREFIVDELSNIRDEGIIDQIISGMALGFDQALAEAAVELDIPLVAAIPFKGFESKWPNQSQYEYKKLLEKAEKIVTISSGGYSNRAYFDRDKYMVDNCDILLALYSGAPNSGTKITIDYAKKVGKDIRNCWVNWIEYE